MQSDCHTSTHYLGRVGVVAINGHVQVRLSVLPIRRRFRLYLGVQVPDPGGSEDWAQARRKGKKKDHYSQIRNTIRYKQTRSKLATDDLLLALKSIFAPCPSIVYCLLLGFWRVTMFFALCASH